MDATSPLDKKIAPAKLSNLIAEWKTIGTNNENALNQLSLAAEEIAESYDEEDDDGKQVCSFPLVCNPLLILG